MNAFEQTLIDDSIIRISELSIGKNRETPRLWIEGKYLSKAGFSLGSKIAVVLKDKQLIISLNNSGTKIVSSKKDTPVIDINNKWLGSIFNVFEKVKMIVKFGSIVVTRTKKILRKLSQLRDKSCGSVFSGGGLLDQAAVECGFNTKFAIECNPKYADVWQVNHNGIMLNMDISDVDFNLLPKVELLIGGIPCEPFSIARRQKGNDVCEMHDNADLSMFFLMIVEAVNPRVILLEEVPYYIKSGIGITTIAALKRMGYNVRVETVKGTDYGSFETRKRVVIIASMEEIEFPEKEVVKGKMSDILLHPEDPRCEWFDEKSKPWIFKHWKNQELKGNNFNEKFVNMIDENSTYVNTITKRYMNIQGSNPLVRHPSKQGVFRLLTIDEIRKIKQVNEKYYLGDFKTFQGEILGQAVLVKVFSKIIEKVTGMVTP